MITIANLLSADLDGLAEALRFACQASWQEEARVLESPGLADFRHGRADAVLICGLAYALLRDAAPGRYMPVAAPVVDDERGRGEPVYFADIVVPAASRTVSLADLRGGRLAFNEMVSFSGYRALEHALEERGRISGFFSERIRCGSHHASLAHVAAGEADAAAIDSQVLLLARRRDPGLAARIRRVDALGPYPAPPLVARVDGRVRTVAEWWAVLERLPRDVLDAAAIRRWQAVEDTDYDPIRATVDARRSHGPRHGQG